MITTQTLPIKTSLIWFTFACYFSIIPSWSQDGVPDIHSSLSAETERIYETLVEIRRDIHRHPEIAGQEERTSKVISDYLGGLGLKVRKGIGGYGVIGILEGGKKGKSVAWRADIDALKTDFPDVVDFKSKYEGIRHICGHDVHTVIALGMAHVLSQHRERLKGTVYFLFQPAEENIQGAKAMIADGALEIMDADEIYALHMSPYPVGTIATKKNEVYGDYKRLEVTLSTKADSTETVDFVREQITGIQEVANLEKFNDPMTLGDPELGIAGPKTIYKDYISVAPNFYINDTEGNRVVTTHISSSDQDKLEKAKVELERRLKQSHFGNAILDIAYIPVTYTPNNHPELVESAIHSITEIYGDESFMPLYGVIPGGTGDDFALFQEHVPGVYFFLGGSNFEEGKIAMPHTPDFVVDEESIRIGVNYFSSMIVERLAAE